ncbi:hypothetical protein Slin_0154 [Spirosoma linguale DSM 74]|uniref:Uncharacterized protein n=1 Tax=Spirosoma linguale (strain ATCC 33905 / DSM 74 / LMG 10896 / Claus 1) TaxID=504472 RepID=D2QCA9_SPILD|nr:hypothetical protein Slin_0154 [Spirosoma linguale DSM 74]
MYTHNKGYTKWFGRLAYLSALPFIDFCSYSYVRNQKTAE